ncbi:evolutionarily conserved signaling intermediate in Toll pathway, mitochondrial isoform X1 [Octopus bimaculoides]|nr:evolutionarily conserved signaling intermediate in Toll pathway, mitochondrial isoform X1 [Octopus bimaculoides]|eukprot:XP_014777169.1 PREDICTED: evolutionarily conserved signaling intermediate in Toll pathway, mitochondrial-like isoform X1 [Octopus bimaculoides]
MITVNKMSPCVIRGICCVRRLVLSKVILPPDLFQRLHQVHRLSHLSLQQPFRTLSLSSLKYGKKEKQEQIEKEKRLIIHSQDYFDQFAEKEKNRAMFKAAVDGYIIKENVYRRGHVEFAYAAVNKLKAFGSERDLSSYKKILEVFPKYKMIPKNAWQVEMMHYPKQQQCVIDMLDTMERNAVIPDMEFGIILSEIFGLKAHVFRKYQRMMYWLPKMKNLNPYHVPLYLPEDPTYLAILALKRMAVDLENKISLFWTTEIEKDPEVNTFIASAQSPSQQELLNKHDELSPLTVEGGHTVWLRNVLQTYFVLIAEKNPNESLKAVEAGKKLNEDDDADDLFGWNVFTEEEHHTQLSLSTSLHQQPEGTILAMCITGTSTKASLVTWIRGLQKTNPKLEKIPVVFKLKTPESLPDITTDQPQDSNLPSANTS